MGKDELAEFKKKILAQLEEHGISTYKFAFTPENPKDNWMCDLAPFAVVGSNTIIQDGSGKKVRGRSYPWGTVSIEDKQHCDFLALRTLLLSHHMQDLIETTSLEHYENYRSSKLRDVQQKYKNGSEPPNKNPLAALEDDRNEHDQKVLQMTLDMESVFRRKVEAKEGRVGGGEEDLGVREQHFFGWDSPCRFHGLFRFSKEETFDDGEPVQVWPNLV